ncbi:MAG TPA: glycosyltransferase family 39 protein [Candidatus Levybacteria bacterium]|nr:glycosyltransferase family 39 protein [Candidatus Levybacteria bacterium]
MKKNKNKLFLILCVSIIIVGFLLRFHNYNVWPRLGATFDEYAWTWQGMNLIQQGVPISWSPHPQYANSQSIVYQQTHFRIVRPFLEHPPLFGIVAGGFAILNGATDMYSLHLSQIRPLALILGMLSLALIIALSTELYGKKIGIFVGILYATIPTIVIGSRIVQNENFFIPVWLFALFLTARYIRTKRKWLRNLVILLCALLVLAKIPWVAAGLSIIAIFLYYKNYKDAVFVLSGILTAFIFFALYGLFFDWNLFVNLWKLQAARYDITFTSIYALFQKPFLIDRYYTDGWIYFGWFAAILLFSKDVKKYIFVVAPIVSYFLIFLAGIPDEAGHGWYRYPFYPFLIISIALFIKDYYAKNFLLTFIFLVLIGTSLFGNTWGQVFGYSVIVFRVIIVSWAFVLMSYLPLFKNTDKFGKVVSYSWFYIFILMNIWSVLIYNEQ